MTTISPVLPSGVTLGQSSDTSDVTTPAISDAMAPVCAADTTDAALTALGFRSGIHEIIINGASHGQTYSFATGNGNYSGGAAQLTDTASGASFTASVAGNNLVVTAVASGYLETNLYVFGNGISSSAPYLITGQVSGTPGGIGTYTLSGSPLILSSGPMSAETYSTCFGFIGTMSNPGSQMFPFFQMNVLNAAGTVVGEIDCVNNTGVNPTGTFPPGQVFGTTDHICIGTQWVALGTAQSQAAWQIIPGNNTFQAGGYIWPGAVSTYGIWVDASSTQGAAAAAVFKATPSGIPLTLQTKGVAVPTNPAMEVLNDAGTVMMTVRQNGSIFTAGIIGATAGSAIGAGLIGELVAGSGSSITLGSGTAANLASISLSAGEWDVSGSMAGSVSAGQTVNAQAVGISLATGTMPAFGSYTSLGAAAAVGTGHVISTPVVRVAVSTTTTVYLVGEVFLSGGTSTANAGSMRARRVG